MNIRQLLTAWIILLSWYWSANAQTTAFTYQGKLTNAGSPANDNFDLQFKLFDTVTVGTGTQQGATLVRNPVAVSAGVFTVTLDFGANVFSGADRYLEIGVRPAGSVNAYTVLAPRQPLTASPYAIQTLNAQQLGGVAASNYLKLNASGNVGIGTASPTAKLTVSGAGAFDAPGAPRFDLFNTTAGTGFLQHVNDSGLWQIGTTGGATRLAIDPMGRVGIGTINPQSMLSVQTIGPGHGITHTNGTVTVGSYIDATGGWLGTRSNHPLNFFTNDGATQMRLGTNGYLGIGTTNPTAKLTVSGAGAFNALGAARFDLFNTVSGTGFLQNVTDSGLFQIATTAGNTRLAIDPNGNVGVGTATPQAKLQVAGTGANGFTLGVEGNVTQNRDKGGFVKAMVYVNGDGTILRCYNGLTGASTGNCGIGVTYIGSGTYNLTFPFQINDRFYSVSVRDSFLASVTFQIFDSTLLRVTTFGIDPAEISDRPFTLIVY